MIPKRIQRIRAKGFNLQQHSRSLNGLECVYVGRPGKWGNPFKVGGLYKIGNGKGGFSWLRCLDQKWNDGTFTEMKTVQQCIDWYKLYISIYPPRAEELAELAGKNLSCWCKIGEPCHADVLLMLANK